MELKDWLVINNVNTLDYDGIIVEKNIDNKPNRVRNKVKIPGRNGSLTISDGGYENVPISYTIGFETMQKYHEYMDMLQTSGFVRIEDSEYPDEFRNGTIEKISLNRKGWDHDTVLLTIELDCKPQRFLKAGEKWVVSDANTATGGTGLTYLYNPTRQTARPLIFVERSGMYTLGDYTIKTTQNGIYIDCEMMDSYFSNKTNANKYVSLSNGFPMLMPGRTSRGFKTTETNINPLKIQPRWWRS